MHKVFVYGTLRKGECNHNYIQESTFLGDAVSKDAVFFLSGQGAVPCLMEGIAGNKIKGELYSIDDETLDCIDRLEGHPNVYRRFRKVFECDDEEHIAWVYLNRPQKTDFTNAVNGVLEHPKLRPRGTWL